MSTEELLKPRYKVIADYPDSPFNIGSIHRFGDALPPPGVRRMSDYPHLFKPLQWWQERKESDMPQYVKHKNGEYYKHKYMFEKELYYNQECAGHWIGWLEVNDDFNDYQPITEQEYLKNKS